MGRPDGDWAQGSAMTLLGNGLLEVGHADDSLSVREAALSMLRRTGAPEEDVLRARSNLANTYQMLGQAERTLRMRRDLYSECLKLLGEEHLETMIEACNHASLLKQLNRFNEIKALLVGTIPVARRVLGESHDTTLTIRSLYAEALCRDPGATLDDIREAVATLEEIGPTARRFLGGAHPETAMIEQSLRAALRARETQSSSASA